jgi:hypothetical protein
VARDVKSWIARWQGGKGLQKSALRVDDGYLAALEEFQFWCAANRLPFKWAMRRAMKRYMEKPDEPEE